MPLHNPSPPRPTARATRPTTGYARAAQQAAAAHYENFPVASWLCPPHLRTPIAAIYHFARTADDLADEGSADAPQRLTALAEYRSRLWQAAQGAVIPGPWQEVFAPLAIAIAQHDLPVSELDALLDAFMQDVRYTAAGTRYADDDALLDYCRRSANPVGRLLLHLYGVNHATAVQQSDCICSALQLINFWQDLSVDLPRGRWYPSLATQAHFGVSDQDLLEGRGNALKMIAHYARFSRALMLKGADLVFRVPGRAGWELRAVVQGGLRILDHIERLGWATMHQRPTVGRRDLPALAWRVLTMRRSRQPPSA